MKKVLVTILFVIAASVLFAQKQTKTDFTYRLDQKSDWVFYSPTTPSVDVVITNTEEVLRGGNMSLSITTDTREPLYQFSQQFAVNANDSVRLNFSFSLPSPGFYRCTLKEQRAGRESIVRRFNIGYEPTAIVSLGDAKPDIRDFWDESLAELEKIAPEYKFVLLPEKSTTTRNIYQVSMKSFGDEEISGYYATPVKKGKYPAIISYMGYGSTPWIPNADSNAEFVEFVLSVRGQALNQSNNKYGDWITFGLDNKDEYYYRGAFMDLVRAIDFIESRPEVRKEEIFAEGGSQGGAFTLAACALDDRIRAAAPWIPFLSDYPDYFRIVHWPAEPILKKQTELKISDKDLYATLSYFDVKNLAPWIQCPVFMGVGLQDEVCPPHTNFAGFNRITSQKSYHIYPNQGHDVGSNWWDMRMKFYKQFIK